MHTPSTAVEATTRRFRQSNFDTTRPKTGMDFGRRTRRGRQMIGTVLVALFPMVASAAEAKSTYGQRIVAAVLMAEARGEGELGMTAVAEVIRNRADQASRSPLNIVLRKGQFSSLKDTTPEALYRKYSRMKQFPIALRIAKTCYNTPENLPNLARGATFFDRTEHRPAWLVAMRPVTSVGSHRFYVPKTHGAGEPVRGAEAPDSRRFSRAQSQLLSP